MTPTNQPSNQKCALNLSTYFLNKSEFSIMLFSFWKPSSVILHLFSVLHFYTLWIKLQHAEYMFLIYIRLGI